jgi:hypothetical protein
MAIPYNPLLSVEVYKTGQNPFENEPVASTNEVNQVKRAISDIFDQTVKQPVIRGVQFVRDAARLVFKVPVRAIVKPIFQEKNWQELERAKVNAKLTGYSFVQFVSVPAKFAVAFAALTMSAFSAQRAKKMLDYSEGWKLHLDGRAAQLEALKEQGAKKITDKVEFEKYRIWLYNLDPKKCLA